jgi:hypothetical protein
MNDPITYAISACLGSALGIILAEFVLIPYLKKKINK